MPRHQWWTPYKQHMNERATKLGHRPLTWEQLPRPAGTALIFKGTCTDCGATIQIDRSGSSSSTTRNARDDACTGPGTAILTEIEQDRSDELIGEAIGEYLHALADAGITFPRPQTPFRNPLAPAGECGVMSKDGYICIRRLNRRGTHNGNEWGGPDGHVGTRPDDGFTHPFNDADVLTVQQGAPQ